MGLDRFDELDADGSGRLDSKDMAQKDEQFREKVQSLDAAASHRVLRPATPEFQEVLRWSKMMGRVAIPLMLDGLFATVPC